MNELHKQPQIRETPTESWPGLRIGPKTFPLTFYGLFAVTE